MKPCLLRYATGLMMSAAALAQVPHGTVERIVVHGQGLEGNLEGDSPDRDVAVYLPPSYGTAPARRYPVVYLLHGFTDNVDNWWGVNQHFINVPAVMDKALAGGNTREMIVVMPNAFTRYQGSMYSTSATTGDWEGFIANELVSYIDHHYRTIASVRSRGLAGHSMGGYGTVRIGMRHPDAFSSIYALSPCCMLPGQPDPARMAAAEKVLTPEDIAKADFGTKAALASAAAWSPNPGNPPLYLDLPAKDGEVRPEIVAKWNANAPLAMVDQYVPNLKRLHAIAMDAGTQDNAIARTVTTLDGMLTAYGIAHFYELYEGNHTNHVAERVEMKMLPFFSSNLEFDKK